MRLATFNLLHGRTPADGVVDLNRLVAAVRTLDADILALQEVDRDQPRSHLADLTAVAAEAMGAQSHRFVAAIAGTPGATWMAATGREAPGEATYGIALLSRYPAHHWQVAPAAADPTDLSAVADQTAQVDRGSRGAARRRGRTVRHADRRPHRGQHAPVVRPGLGGGCNSTGSLVILLRCGDPVVIMGDLNMPAPQPERISGYSSLTAHPTFPQQLPETQLDHILLRGRLGPVTGSDAVDLGLSDHRALWVDVAG